MHRLHRHLPAPPGADDMLKRHHGVHVDYHPEFRAMGVSVDRDNASARPFVGGAGVVLFRRHIHAHTQHPRKIQECLSGRSAGGHRVSNPTVAVCFRSDLCDPLQRHLRFILFPAPAPYLDTAGVAHHPLGCGILLFLTKHSGLQFQQRDRTHFRGI